MRHYATTLRVNKTKRRSSKGRETIAQTSDSITIIVRVSLITGNYIAKGSPISEMIVPS